MEKTWEPEFIPNFDIKKDFSSVLYSFELVNSSKYGITINSINYTDISNFIGMVIMAAANDKEIFGKILGFSRREGGRWLLYEPRPGFYDLVDLAKVNIVLSDKKHLKSQNLI